MLARVRPVFSTLRLLRASRVLAACALLALAGCAKDPAPVPVSTVQGTVHHDDGSPASVDLALQTLVPTGASDELFVQFSDAAGHYEFGDLSSGTYVLSAFDPLSDAVAGDTIQVGNGVNVTAPLLTLEPSGGFRGRVTLQGATDHRDTHLSVRGFLAFATSDSVGDYVLVGLPEGRWSMVAEHPNYVTATRAATIAAPGDTATVPDFVLTP